MKCRKQLRFYRVPIASLWEVNLERGLWERVRKAAEYRQCTYSWITRYCVFRLARKKNVRMTTAMEFHSCGIKRQQKKCKNYHRHILCLYGDDEMLLRLTAMKLGVTVSQLIRLALYWFLPKIETLKVRWDAIFYHGTKICRFLDFSRTNILQMPFYEVLFYGKWPPENWWKRPIRSTIQIPFTPELGKDNFNP